MTPRRLLFLLGLLAIPALLGMTRVSPLMAERKNAQASLTNANAIQIANQQVLAQRDRLMDQWHAFQPLAEEALENLDQRLNPVLVQKRVFDLGTRLGCEVRIQEKTDRVLGGHPTYALSAEGEWENIVRFVGELETGTHLIRMEEVGLSLPSADYPDGGVRLHGVFRLPVLTEPQG